MSEHYETPTLHPSPLEYIYDSSNTPERISQLRILNSASLPFSVHISLDHTPFAAGVLPLTATNYGTIAPGRRSLSVLHGEKPSVFLLEEFVPLSQNSYSTAVLADSSRSGICLFCLTDLNCRTTDQSQSYIRVFNGAMEQQPLSLAQWNSGMLWEQIPFGSASSYRIIQPGPHSFYIPSHPQSSLALTVKAGCPYTLYLTGNTWSPKGLRILPLLDGC